MNVLPKIPKLKPFFRCRKPRGNATVKWFISDFIFKKYEKFEVSDQPMRN